MYKTTADYIPVDLSKESQIEGYVQEIRKLYPHGVDILVNNAGNSQKFLLYADKCCVCQIVVSLRPVIQFTW